MKECTVRDHRRLARIYFAPHHVRRNRCDWLFSYRVCAQFQILSACLNGWLRTWVLMYILVNDFLMYDAERNFEACRYAQFFFFKTSHHFLLHHQINDWPLRNWIVMMYDVRFAHFDNANLLLVLSFFKKEFIIEIWNEWTESIPLYLEVVCVRKIRRRPRIKYCIH